MESQYDGECSLCHNKFKKGEQIHISKVGDKWVKCTDETCFKEQGGKVYEKKSGSGGRFTSAKFPIGDAPKIYCLAEELLEQFYKKRGTVEGTDGFDQTVQGVESRLPIQDEAVFIESVFRTLSQNFKPEAQS